MAKSTSRNIVAINNKVRFCSSVISRKTKKIVIKMSEEYILLNWELAIKIHYHILSLD